MGSYTEVMFVFFTSFYFLFIFCFPFFFYKRTVPSSMMIHRVKWKSLKFCSFAQYLGLDDRYSIKLKFLNYISIIIHYDVEVNGWSNMKRRFLY